jgi:hypothetical protein
MKIEQAYWYQNNSWNPPSSTSLSDAQLALVFGSTQILKDQQFMTTLRTDYPNAYYLGCSTSGEICDTRVTDDSLIVTAIYFEHTVIKGSSIKIDSGIDSFTAGKRLAQQLDKQGLVHIFVLSDGLCINGTDLVAGITNQLPPHIAVTGGLAGDGTQFAETFVLDNNSSQQNLIAVLGFYGDRLRIGYGSLGGWDAFGPERLITRSNSNVLYELDGTSALDLYKTYLGSHAKGLPSTGLLFPLSLRSPDSSSPIVRTILGVDDQKQSMTFAGDMPEGAYARFMKANFDRIVVGAKGAAMACYESIGSFSPDLAILISCVGRKLVLKQRTEEEIEGARQVFGDKTVLTGFYSYGEISPFAPGSKCELHNQTMTITAFAEK